jgi:hypothetical protein
MDTSSRSLSRKDTLILAAPSTQAKPGEWLNTFVAHNDAEGVVRQLRRIESQLPAGRYRITVTVTNSTGRRTGSGRQFVIPPPADPGRH